MKHRAFTVLLNVACGLAFGQATVYTNGESGNGQIKGSDDSKDAAVRPVAVSPNRDVPHHYQLENHSSRKVVSLSSWSKTVTVAVSACPTATVNSSHTSPGPYTSKTCRSMVTSTILTTIKPITTVTYEINHGRGTIDGDPFTSYDHIQLRPTTIYPTTRYTVAATFTSLAFVTPSTTLGTFRTIIATPPPDFLPISSTLPQAYIGQNWNRKRSPRKEVCSPMTTTITKSVMLPTATSTAYTTLSGIIYTFSGPSLTLDEVAISKFDATYTGPVTVTATTPQIVTTSYQTTITKTITLPVQTVTATTSYVYPACETDTNLISAVQRGADYFGIIATAAEDINPDGRYISSEDCCIRAFRLGGVAYWQKTVNQQCLVYRVAADNRCVQSGHNVTVNAQPLGNPYSEVGAMTGNGVCGRVTTPNYQPPSNRPPRYK